MAQVAVEDYKYVYNTCRDTIKFTRACSLHNALNKSTTTFSDVMKWQYQIAEFGKYITAYNKGYLFPVDVKLVSIDEENNIMTSTLYNCSDKSHKTTLFMTANSMIDCNRIMLEAVNFSNKPRTQRIKFEMFRTLSEIVIDNNIIKYQNDVVSGAFYTVNKLSEMIENGLIDILYEIARDGYNNIDAKY